MHAFQLNFPSSRELSVEEIGITKRYLLGGNGRPPTQNLVWAMSLNIELARRNAPRKES